MTTPRCLLAGLLLVLSGCDRPIDDDAVASPAPPAGAAAASPTPSPFHDAAEEVGLTFRHENGMTGQRYILEIMGPGSALLDYDGDGDLDVFLVQGRSLAPDADTDPQQPIHRLFRNDLKPDSDGRPVLRFTDVTAEAGLALSDYGMGAAAADYDRDGHIDLYVTCFGRDRLLRNTGRGQFVDVTASAGLTAEPAWSTSASWSDFDRDGHLDLFVCQYLDWTLATHVTCRSPWGAQGYCGPKTFPPSRSRLYRNEGNGTFRDVSESSHINSRAGAGLSVVGADFDGDGWTDFLVANDAMPNHLWMNQHDGTFREEAALRGCAVNAEGMAEGNMGIIVADFFHAGRYDLFITHLKSEHATFYRNLGEGLFTDVTASLGLDAPTRAYTGFGTGAVDYDNDGALDIFLTNGDVQIDPEQDRAGILPPLRQPCLLFRNRGGSEPEFAVQRGYDFLDVEAIGRGAAFGDLDNDGDVDIVVNNNHGPVRLLLNDVGQDRHWLGLRIVDGPAGGEFDVVGATVQLARPGQPVAHRRCATDGSYLSSSDPRIVFGLGDSPATGTVRVRWPDGDEEEWENLAAGQYHLLRKSSTSGSREPAAGDWTSHSQAPTGRDEHSR